MIQFHGRIVPLMASKVRSKMCLAFWPSVAAVLILAGSIGPAVADQLNSKYAFNIDAGQFHEALLQFATQAHLSINFRWIQGLADRRVAKVAGVFTARQALAQILKTVPAHYIVTGDIVTIEADRRSRLQKPRNIQRETSDPKPLTRSDTSRQGPTHQPAEETTPLELVVVSAQKYRQSELDVPISLVVIGSQQLKKEGIRDLNDLQYDVPGLRVEGGGAQQRIIIRGVGNQYGNGAYVSEYIDDADVTNSGWTGAQGYGGADLQVFDLKRVEVLRGPQGTLYGGGAIGGIIRFITNKPVIDRLEAEGAGRASFTQSGSPGQYVEGMVNIPLVTGTMALRLAGISAHDGGWINQPAAAVKDFNDANVTNVRVEGLWRPISALSIRITHIDSRDHYGLTQGEQPIGELLQPFGVTRVPNGTKQFSMSNATINYSTNGIRLISSSTRLNSHENLNNLSVSAPGGTSIFATGSRVSEGKFTQELRLENSGVATFHWALGGFYDHARGGIVNGDIYEGFDAVPATLLSLSTALELQSGYLLQRADSWAAFGNSSYTIAHRLVLGAGARYYSDGEYALGYPNCPCNARFSSTDPRAYLLYKVTARANVYIGASKGFRTGGFNVYSPPHYVPPYQPETLWNYEFGTKFRTNGNQLGVNADVFLSEYSDYLGFRVNPGFSGTFNIGEAHIKGIEGNVLWRPNRNWIVKFGGVYLDAKLVSLIPSAIVLAYKVGDEIPLSSKYQISTALERDFTVDSRPAYARVQFSKLGRQVSYEPFEYSDPISMLGVEAGVHWTRGVKVGVFAKNLLNDRGLLDPFSEIGWASRPRPRTYGLDFRVAFSGGKR